METVEKAIQAFSVPVLIFAWVIGSSLFCWFVFNAESGTSVSPVSIDPIWLGVGLVLVAIIVPVILLVKVIDGILA